MIQKITDAHVLRQKYDELEMNDDSESSKKGNESNKTRKEPQCTFRLVNILFSDAFAEKLSTLGNVAPRNILDTGKAAKDQYFWEEVQQAFCTPNVEYDFVGFQDDPVFAFMCDVDPSKIVQHDWQKLQSIWKGLNADYKASLNKFTLSGTHDSDFYSFC